MPILATMGHEDSESRRGRRANTTPNKGVTKLNTEIGVAERHLSNWGLSTGDLSTGASLAKQKPAIRTP